jgi:tetratricopeptide (TPR) repeat protein
MRYGFASGLEWNDAELVYDSSFRGYLEETVARATQYLEHESGAKRYQTPPVLATRARALLARGQVDAALADAERALRAFRERGADAQIAEYILTVASRCLRAAGREAEADSALADALVTPDAIASDLPLHLVELDRGEEYLTLMEGTPGHLWLEAGRSAAAGDLARASEIYGSMGARFAEAWAALLAAERGDTSRLDAALAYFEEQQATPYVQRCRALMQASA